jgi:hypothetical protein
MKQAMCQPNWATDHPYPVDVVKAVEAIDAYIMERMHSKPPRIMPMVHFADIIIKNMPQASDTELGFMGLMVKECEAAQAKHGNIPSLHAGYGILLEELDEFWEEVKKQSGNRIAAKLVLELVQIAATAKRVSEFIAENPKVAKGE